MTGANSQEKFVTDKIPSLVGTFKAMFLYYSQL